MIQKISVRPAVLVVLVSLLAWMAAGCSSTRSYDEPAATTTSARSQLAETGPQGLTVDGLVEYGRSFPRGLTSQGRGQLEIEDRNFVWRSDKKKRSFSIQVDVIKNATLRCASRPGGNICLELQIETVTDLDYAFRDANWAAGHNEQITQVFNYLKANFPRITFSEESVKKID